MSEHQRFINFIVSVNIEERNENIEAVPRAYTKFMSAINALYTNTTHHVRQRLQPNKGIYHPLYFVSVP